MKSQDGDESTEGLHFVLVVSGSAAAIRTAQWGGRTVKLLAN